MLFARNRNRFSCPNDANTYSSTRLMVGIKTGKLFATLKKEFRDITEVFTSDFEAIAAGSKMQQFIGESYLKKTFIECNHTLA